MPVDDGTLIKATQCECPQCSCTLESQNMVTRNNKRYCSEACADGHTSSQGCEHSGCKCA